MIRRIVVPLDGTPEGDAILPLVGRIARQKQAHVVLVRAVPWPFAEAYGFIGPSLLADAEKELQEVRRSIGEEDGRRVRAVAKFGLPARLIVEVAEREEASLVAMSTKARAGWSRLLFGSVTEEVIARGATPVLAVPTAPARAGGREMRRILVPYDDSRSALFLLQSVVELAQVFDSEVLLLPLRPDPGVSRPRPEEEIDLAYILRKREVKTVVLEADGPPLEEVDAAAWKNDVDLIALTLRRPPTATALTRAAGVRKILRQTRRPVLVARDRLMEFAANLSPLRVRTAG